jgi:hypothetical protein
MERGRMIKTCADCGGSFEAQRTAAKYCSERCKKRAQRRPLGVIASPAVVGGLRGFTEKDLADLRAYVAEGIAAGLVWQLCDADDELAGYVIMLPDRAGLR